jgi:hypothetical protein
LQIILIWGPDSDSTDPSGSEIMVEVVFQALLAVLAVCSVSATSQPACRETKVVVLGAGVAGITAAVRELGKRSGIHADVANSKLCPITLFQTS